MIDDACTYLPPTCAITSAYSFSAPIAVILVTDAAAPDAPPAALDDDADEHALAISAAARGSATARTPERVRMTLYSQGEARRLARGVENDYRYDNHFQ
jgi:hypothetical protein